MSRGFCVAARNFETQTGRRPPRKTQSIFLRRQSGGVGSIGSPNTDGIRQHCVASDNAEEYSTVGLIAIKYASVLIGGVMYGRGGAEMAKLQVAPSD